MPNDYIFSILRLKNYFPELNEIEWLYNKVGGLDVETNRDRDRERPTCRDELF